MAAQAHEEQDGLATLRITRTDSWVSRLAPLEIRLDGRPVGRLKGSEELCLKVAAVQHELYCTHRLQSSDRLMVLPEAGQTISVSCGFISTEVILPVLLGGCLLAIPLPMLSPLQGVTVKGVLFMLYLLLSVGWIIQHVRRFGAKSTFISLKPLQ